VPPSNRALDVFAAQRLTGTLSRSDLEIDTFLFGYLKETQAEDAVSLTMPVVADQYDSVGAVHPIFEMNLPEGALPNSPPTSTSACRRRTLRELRLPMFAFPGIGAFSSSNASIAHPRAHT
jgi:hypothetical protein